MPKLSTNIYTIIPLTNLHAGSGDTNYGIVDRMVQRDPVSNAPTIHTSGIKGAIRQYFSDQYGKTGPAEGQNHPEVTDLFGSGPQASSADMKQGNLRFISADLLAIPGPDTSEDPNAAAFHLYYDPAVITAWIQKARAFHPGFDYPIPADWKSDSARFRELYEDLPVIARNFLDNGESKNLWYEEVVPHQSVFGFVVQGEAAHLTALANGPEGKIGIHNKVVQLGANATVGYGYCKFEKIA